MPEHLWYLLAVAYFEDLTGYSYSDQEVVSLDDGYVTINPRYTRLNVGWLDPAHDVPQGPVPPDFLGALLEIVAGPHTNVMRGFHMCQFCPPSHDIGMMPVEHRGRTLWLGHSEIRVPDGPTVMFAAPTLIWHYVDAHGYRPPDRFIAAVDNYDSSWMTSVGS